MSFIKLNSVTVNYDLHNPYTMNLKRSLLSLFRTTTDFRSSITALNDVSLELPAGTRLGLIGENGAGKTTLLKVLAGSLPPVKGTVEFEGRIQSFLGSAIHGLDNEMSGDENIEYVSLINSHRVTKG